MLWADGFESIGMNINPVKDVVGMSGGNEKYELFTRKFSPCWIFRLEGKGVSEILQVESW